MAVIDYEAVKTSVGEVYKAGKEFPQKELFFAAPQDNAKNMLDADMASRL